MDILDISSSSLHILQRNASTKGVSFEKLIEQFQIPQALSCHCAERAERHQLGAAEEACLHIRCWRWWSRYQIPLLLPIAPEIQSSAIHVNRAKLRRAMPRTQHNPHPVVVKSQSSPFTSSFTGKDRYPPSNLLRSSSASAAASKHKPSGKP